ncbi:hypothetical protein [Octadecabacter sp. R77987]|uniref:hypothetical protein n=1 Tax=Octadecabacter sp. R77987 TaxID=3093874 RepID=UPI003671853A
MLDQIERIIAARATGDAGAVTPAGAITVAVVAATAIIIAVVIPIVITVTVAAPTTSTSLSDKFNIAVILKEGWCALIRGQLKVNADWRSGH